MLRRRGLGGSFWWVGLAFFAWRVGLFLRKDWSDFVVFWGVSGGRVDWIWKVRGEMGEEGLYLYGEV